MESFAGKIRKIVRDAAGREVAAKEISWALDLDAGKKASVSLYKTLGNLARSGEIERVRPGVYKWKGKDPGALLLARKTRHMTQLREIMWRVLRAKRTVTVDDLRELSGANERYAKEWLNMLVRRGVVRKNKNKTYQIVSDPVQMPQDEKKAERLRRIRQNKKNALLALDEAYLAITRARMAITEIGEAQR